MLSRTIVVFVLFVLTGCVECSPGSTAAPVAVPADAPRIALLTLYAPRHALLRFDVDDVEIEFFYDPEFDESTR